MTRARNRIDPRDYGPGEEERRQPTTTTDVNTWALPVIAGLVALLFMMFVDYASFGQALFVKQLRGGYVVADAFITGLIVYVLVLRARYNEQQERLDLREADAVTLRNLNREFATLMAAIPADLRGHPEELLGLFEKLRDLPTADSINDLLADKATIGDVNAIREKTDALPTPAEIAAGWTKLDALPTDDTLAAHLADKADLTHEHTAA